MDLSRNAKYKETLRATLKGNMEIPQFTDWSKKPRTIFLANQTFLTRIKRDHALAAFPRAEFIGPFYYRQTEKLVNKKKNLQSRIGEREKQRVRFHQTG